MPAWTYVNKVSSLVTEAANGFTIISLNIRKIAYHMAIYLHMRRVLDSWFGVLQVDGKMG